MFAYNNSKMVEKKADSAYDCPLLHWQYNT